MVQRSIHDQVQVQDAVICLARFEAKNVVHIARYDFVPLSAVVSQVYIDGTSQEYFAFLGGWFWKLEGFHCDRKCWLVVVGVRHVDVNSDALAGLSWGNEEPEVVFRFSVQRLVFHCNVSIACIHIDITLTRTGQYENGWVVRWFQVCISNTLAYSADQGAPLPAFLCAQGLRQSVLRLSSVFDQQQESPDYAVQQQRPAVDTT